MPQVRPARPDDAPAVAELAEQLAHSLPFSRSSFERTFPELLKAYDHCLLVAVENGEHLGYLLGNQQLTFYAGGPVAWVSEIVVSQELRGRGVGRSLMAAFEEWAARRECAIVALSTRRAAPFYRALGYEESAVYFRRILAKLQPQDER